MVKLSRIQIIYPSLPRGIELGRACRDESLLERLDHYFYTVYFPENLGGDLFFVFKRSYISILQRNCTPLGYAIARLLFSEPSLSEYQGLLAMYESERWNGSFLPYPVGHPRASEAGGVYSQQELDAIVALARETAVQEYKRFVVALEQIMGPKLYSQEELDNAIEQAKIEAVEQYKVELEPIKGLNINPDLLKDKDRRVNAGEIDLQKLQAERFEAMLDRVISPSNLSRIVQEVGEKRYGPEWGKKSRRDSVTAVQANALNDIGQN